MSNSGNNRLFCKPVIKATPANQMDGCVVLVVVALPALFLVRMALAGFHLISISINDQVQVLG